MGAYFMKKVIAGSIIIILSLIGFSIFFQSFITFLAGTIPLLLIIGGGLTIYLNYENYQSDSKDSPEYQDKTRDNTCSSNASLPVGKKENKTADITPGKTDLDDSKTEKQQTSVSTDTDHQFIGNTGSQVFHNLDCKFSKSKNCTARFSTREKAIQEDYKPCGICKP